MKLPVSDKASYFIHKQRSAILIVHKKIMRFLSILMLYLWRVGKLKKLATPLFTNI